MILFYKNYKGAFMELPLVITIGHQKGGVGKSTVAINLLVEFAKEFKTKAIDLDAQRSLTVFNHKRGNNLNVQIVETASMLKEIVNTNEDLLIIDVAGIDSDLNRMAIMAADILITPVSDSEIELFGLMNFKRIIQQIHQVRDDLRATVLLNRINPRSKHSAGNIREFVDESAEFDMFKTIIRDRIDFKRSFAKGSSVVEMKSNSEAAVEIKSLIEEIKAWQK